MDAQISNIETIEVDEIVSRPVSKDGDVEQRIFSPDFIAHAVDDLTKGIGNVLRVYGLEELINIIDNLVMLNMLIIYKPADYSPDGPEGYNQAVNENLGEASWNIFSLQKTVSRS